MSCSAPPGVADGRIDGEASVRRSTPVFALVAVLVLASAGCGGSSKKSSSSDTTTSRPTDAGSQTITIQNFKYSPDPISVKAGTKVTVSKLDDVSHSASADDNSFDTGIFSKSQSPKVITLSKAGTVKYHCNVHNFMHGTIQVS
jgi:plastocyanin